MAQAIQPEDFKRCDWTTVPDESQSKTCWDYSERFLVRAQEADVNSNNCSHVYRFLSDVTAPALRFHVKGKPFAPAEILESLDPEDLRELAQHIDLVDDSELRARISDLAWVKLRSHKMGQVAVANYLEVASLHGSTDDWMHAESAVHRALNLSLELRNENLTERVVAYIDAILSSYDETNQWKYLASHLMEMLLGAKHGDAAKLSKLSRQIANSSEVDQDWDRARTYWHLAARWDDRSNEKAAASEARSRTAHTFVEAAEEASAKGGPWLQNAASDMLRAVNAYQELGERTKADSCHSTALRFQAEARKYSQSISHDFNLASYVDEARAAISGKAPIDALFSLADIAESPSEEWIRDLTEQQIVAFPIQHLIGSVLRSDDGRVLAKRPSHASDNEDDRSRAMRADMLGNAQWFRETLVQAKIEPARWQLLLEHNIETWDIFPMLVHSPFIPPGREALYAQGLISGLHGDFVAAAHILVPQVENSIRFLLKRRGLLTSRLENAVQEERDLNTLLLQSPFSDAVKDIFRQDITFDLQGLLVERFGANLRNRLAHGLLEDADFTTQRPSAIYFWWLVLRLSLWPYLMTIQNADPDPEVNRE